MASARRTAIEAVGAVEGVVSDPAPEALYVELESSTVNLDIRFWCDAHQLEARRTLSRAIEAVKTAFDVEGIEMPSQVIALQGTSSLAAALHGREMTPGGGVANRPASPSWRPDRPRTS